MNEIIIINFLVTVVMMGVIIITQVVNYPLFLHINHNDFKNYHGEYVKRITYIAMPLMSIELLLSGLLIANIPNKFSIIIFIVISLIFISTIFIQVPIHKEIENKYNELSIINLINTNWIRTSLWIIKSIASYYLLKELVWI